VEIVQEFVYRRLKGSRMGEDRHPFARGRGVDPHTVTMVLKSEPFTTKKEGTV